MTFEEYLVIYRTEDGEGPLKHLSAREALIGEILWNAATAAQRAPQPCTHPRACIVVGERHGDEYEQRCSWCASLDAKRRKERERWVIVCNQEIAALEIEAHYVDSESTLRDSLLHSVREIKRVIKKAIDDAPCYVCGGTGDGIGNTDCPVCFGTGKETNDE